MFIERLIKRDPTFPKAVKLTAGTMSHRLWDEDDLEAWERSKAVR
jgi:predicted DNA-binding transcriptional regulator AlpA